MSDDPSRSARVTGISLPGADRILTPDALAFVASLTRRFAAERDTLLARRAERQQAFRAGQLPDFLDETASVRAGDWLSRSCKTRFSKT